MDELIERLKDEAGGYGDGPTVFTNDDIAALRSLLNEAAAALEAAREDAERIKRDVAELYEVMPMLPITAETMDAATDWFTRYCIDFHREINTAIDQARGKESGNG